MASLPSSRTPLMEEMFLMMAFAFLLTLMVRPVHGGNSLPEDDFRLQLQKMQAFRESFSELQNISPSPIPVSAPPPRSKGRIYPVTTYGADPTGKNDSTEAINKAMEVATTEGPGNGFLISGILDLGGVQIDLEGGCYRISRPLKVLPGRGNFMIHGGTLKATDEFPTGGYLLDFSGYTEKGSYNFEFVTLRDLLLDSSFRGGGIQIENSLRIGINNCYITHFTTNGILVQGGHETYIRNSFLGQHVTAGGDPNERNFSATAINLMGNDNAVTDVVIFSAAIGIMVSGQANTFSGVHCYNKATDFGGTGIYLKLPGLTQTRIVNSYMDYTGIVAEDPVQLHISSCFFLGDAFVVLKSIHGVAKGVNIVDNMFSGFNKGTDIVQLDQRNGAFKQVDQVVVDQNNVKGMNLKSTVARAELKGNGSSWTLDFNQILLFPDFINHVQYAILRSSSGEDSSFPKHGLRNVSHNKVFIQSDVPFHGSVFVLVDQGKSYASSTKLVF